MTPHESSPPRLYSQTGADWQYRVDFPGAFRSTPGGAGSRAQPAGITSLVLNDSVVLISGMWQVRTADGKPISPLFCVSLAVSKRGERWLITQFHNSPRPNPPQ